MNGFTEEAQVAAANMSGSQIEQDYESKRTDAWQRIEDLNIVKRIISVCKVISYCSEEETN